MIFILAIGGVWVFLLASLVFLVLFLVFAFAYRKKKTQAKKDISSVTEEELAAAKRLMITNGVVLLILLAAFLVCLTVAGIGIASM